MPSSKPSFTVEQLLDYLEHRLPWRKAKRMAKCVFNMEDLVLTGDFWFLLPHYTRLLGDEVGAGLIQQAVAKQGLCPSRVLLDFYARGGLDTRDVKPFLEAHITSCSACTGAVAESRHIQDSLRTVLQSLEGHSPALVARIRKRAFDE